MFNWPGVMAGIYWKIQGEERTKFDTIFDSLGPVAGKLGGDKVKPVLMNSKLPTDVLGQVWELSDIDKDGFLDREEFCVAMHLVYKALEHEPVPSSLPTDLVPPSKRKTGLAGAVAVLPPIAGASVSSIASNTGNVASGSPSLVLSSISVSSRPGSSLSKDVVPDVEYNRFSGIFAQKVGTDTHIAGATARDIFVQSGLPQPILAHVWNLCDQQQLGKLTQDQFILAMHFISQKVKGVEIPSQLPPEMLPTKAKDSGFGDSGNISDSSSGVGDFSAVRELDALNREIEDLRREKETLIAEKREKEHVVRYKNNEVQDLQNTLDRASTSLSQLESDKAECHTRLDELDQQQLKLDGMLADVRSKVQDETRTIASLQSQIKAQEMAITKQEEEFGRVKNELESLKKEETQLQQTLEIGKQQLYNFSKQASDAEAEIAKVKDQIKVVAEQQKTVTSNIAQYDKAVTALKSETDTSSEFASGGTSDLFGSKDDPFEASDPFGSDSAFKSDPFASDSQFDALRSKSPAAGITSSDPFAAPEKMSGSLQDPFSDKEDPFASSGKSFGTPGFDSDPFGGSDPFSSSSATNVASKQGEKSTAEAPDMFSANFFDQDNSTSLFNDMDQVTQGKSVEDDPWAAFGSGGTSTEDAGGADIFGKDAFMPNSSTNAFNAFGDEFSVEPKSKKTSSKEVKHMSEDAQIAWAAEQSKQAEAERKEKMRIQEQMDLEYAIKLSKEM